MSYSGVLPVSGPSIGQPDIVLHHLGEPNTHPLDLLDIISMAENVF